MCKARQMFERPVLDSSASRAAGHSRAVRSWLSGQPAVMRDAVLTEFRPFSGPNTKVLHAEEWKYVYYQREPYGELMNLKDDPEERRNLYGAPA